MGKLTLERENDVNSLLVEFGEYSSILFEPVEFLLKLKFLAVSLTRPDVLDFVVMKNYLSVFYSSIGHENKSMHLLLPEAGLEDDSNEIPRKRSTGWKKSSRKMEVGFGETGIGGVEAIDTGSLPPSPLNSDGFIDEKSDMGSESRSRKKSKVLVNGFVGSPELVKCTRKNLLRLHPKKFEYPPPDPSRFTPAEFLSDIGSLALDCPYLFRDQSSHEAYVKNASDQEEDFHDASYRGGGRRGRKRKSDQAAEVGTNGYPAAGDETGSWRLPDLNGGQQGMNTLEKRRGRRKEEIGSGEKTEVG
ncbi:hypothetical protein MLD38_032009 [Melastoma candidum]|nr:hypothetical protein MLD38_032009 [Melastoma candidum]